MASASPIKFPSANWSVPLTLSAMDLGMSSGWADFLAAESCGVADFPTAERAMPHMIRRAATRKRVILASGNRKKDTRATKGCRMCRVLALAVRKGSNLDPLLCGLSPPVLEGRPPVMQVYLLKPLVRRQPAYPRVLDQRKCVNTRDPSR